MGKDSANRWLEEIVAVCCLVCAAGPEGDTALPHPYLPFPFVSFPISLSDLGSEDKDSASCPSLFGKVLKDTVILRFVHF